MTPKPLGQSEADLKAIEKWFGDIQDNLGKRAQLRRCETLDEVYFCEGFHDLVSRLKANRMPEEPGAEPPKFRQDQLDSIALLAGTFAILRDWDHGKDSMGKTFASPGGKALSLSPLRFRRLLTCTEPAELLSPLRRAVRLIKLQLPARSLTKSLLFWNDTTRKQWALDYYQHHKQEKNK